MVVLSVVLRRPGLDGGDWPDVLLVDLCMPRMDGWTFISACRQDPRGTDLRVVLMSAALEGCRSVEQGVVFPPKPFDLADLLCTVKHVDSSISELALASRDD